MAEPDPTGNFNAAETRAQLQAAMQLGLPNDEDQRPTFYFPTDDSFVEASMSGAPWDWEATPLENNPDREPVQVPCAVEVSGIEIDLSTVGQFNPQRARLTILDEDFELVRGFHEVTMSGAIYRYSKLVQIIGLYDMDTYIVEVLARDRP